MLITRSILSVPVLVCKRSQAIALLRERLSTRTPTRVAFANAHLLNVAYKDARLRSSLEGFLILNDGVGIDLASKFLYGKSFPANLNGTDFTPYFLKHCRTPLKVFLLGAHPSVVVRVAKMFARHWPQHRLVGYQHGFIPETDERRVIELVREGSPDLVLVAMGNGLQERWVERLVPDVVPSAWGVGALFDFLAGEVGRAPLWMRLLGIEWSYRLWQEPRRLWQRYILGNPKFVLRILGERNSSAQR